jgi:hypothetical protein
VLESRQRRQHVPELAAGDGGHQIRQALALDRGQDPTVDLDRVVAGRQRAAGGRRLLVGERPRIPLVRVDHDLHDLEAGGAGGRQ